MNHLTTYILMGAMKLLLAWVLLDVLIVGVLWIWRRSDERCSR
jgi:hypothetical protein